MIRLASLQMHPLDTLDRMEQVGGEAGIGYCNITKCCTEVCPAGIHITDNGIIPLKERVVDRRFDPLMKILHRKGNGRRRPTKDDLGPESRTA
jgi:succinate dehydrogenase / fumarate reductase iron-sulfur subunit